MLLTVVESPLFSRLWPDYWSEDERGDFVGYLAANAEAGDVIRGTGGCRKVRWRGHGAGKRGGLRIVYIAQPKRGVLILLTIYSKSVRESIAPHVLREIAEELKDATH